MYKMNQEIIYKKNFLRAILNKDYKKELIYFDFLKNKGY